FEQLLDEVPSPPPPMRRRRLVAVILLAVILAGIVTAVFIALGSGGSHEVKTPVPPVALDAAARELLDLMAKGQDGVYHVRYRTISAGQTGATLTVEIWRRGSTTRQDTVASDGIQSIHTAGFTLHDGNVACRRQGSAAWECMPVTGVRTTTQQITELATSELAGRTVTVRDEKVAGRPARCFTIVGEGQSSELCLSRDGVALRVSAGETRLELTSLDAAVPDAIFKPPA
ncbi:MAG: hypothetical protein ACRDKS_04270, partial [Actinomycetota bacterium]